MSDIIDSANDQVALNDERSIKYVQVEASDLHEKLSELQAANLQLREALGHMVVILLLYTDITKTSLLLKTSYTLTTHQR